MRVAMLSITLQYQPPAKTMLILEVMQSWDWTSELNCCWTAQQHVVFASAKELAPYDICQRKFFGYSRWSAVLTFKACTSAENRADLGTKSSPVNRLQQLRRLNGLALDRTENSTDGDEEEGHDENGQRRAAIQTISAPEDPSSEGHSWNEVSIGTQMLDGM